MNRVAIVMLRDPRADKYLVVWNKRYGGFGFPGGKVEHYEEPEQAAFRELVEETNVEAIGTMQQVFEGEHGLEAVASRGSVVHVFECKEFKHAPRESEAGCPVTWWARWEILKWSPFSPFYARVFSALDGVAPQAPKETPSTCMCDCHRGGGGRACMCCGSRP